MSNPKRQHWLPRFYLRYFTTSPSGRREEAWILNRKSGAPRLALINNIAVENHLYAPQLADGTRDFRLERKLSELEYALSRLWPKLASDFVDLGSLETRKGIALFLSVQFLRHPDLRCLANEVCHGLFDKSNVQSLSIRTTAIRDGDQVWLELIEDYSIELAERLMAKRWSIAFVDDPLFITSDHPLYVVNPEIKRHEIGRRGAMILFPISPSRMLCLDDLDAPKDQYHPLPNKEADLYNLFTWVNTDSLIVSPRDIHEVISGIERVHDELGMEMIPSA